MAKGINRYDVAQPAKDNYFNTFVPLPLDQLTALGMARRQELEKNQELLDKAYNDALNIKYIKGSKDEETVKGWMIPEMTKMAQKYAAVDLTNPVELSNMRRELRTSIDPTLVNRIEESYGAWQQAQALRGDLMSKGLYNQKLNEDPATKHDSQMGVYNWLPEAYYGREKLLDPYVKDLKPSYKGISPEGFMISSVDDNDINRIANSRAAELVSTPAGQQELKLFKQDYADLVKDRNMSDVDIMNQIIRDYAEQKKQVIADPLPAHMFNASGRGGNSDLYDDLLHGTRGAEVDSFESISEVTQKIDELKKSGKTQQAKDLAISLKQAMKENNIEDIGDLSTSPEFSFNSLTGVMNIIPNAIIKKQLTGKDKPLGKVLDKVSGTMSEKYGFGFSNLNSTDGKENTSKALAYISQNLIANPNEFALISLNGKQVPKSKKVAEVINNIQTKDLIDFSVNLLPNEDYEYNPVGTFTYQDAKGKKTKVELAFNNPTQVSAIATILADRGDIASAVALTNPHVLHAIENEDLDPGKEVTYQLRNTKNNTNSPVKVKRNDQDNSKFDISYPRSIDERGTIEYDTKTANTRKDLASLMYELMAKNNAGFYKE